MFHYTFLVDGQKCLACYAYSYIYVVPRCAPLQYTRMEVSPHPYNYIYIGGYWGYKKVSRSIYVYIRGGTMYLYYNRARTLSRLVQECIL